MKLRQKQIQQTQPPLGCRLSTSAGAASRRACAATITMLFVGFCTGLLAPLSTLAYGAPISARAAHTVAATDTAHLHLVSSPGSLLLEEGSASGTLPGKLNVRFDVGPTVTASFVIYTKSGAIHGHGSGRLRSAGLYSTFGGSLQIIGGTDRYAHARGHGGLYGSINRRTDALIVQTTGTISY